MVFELEIEISNARNQKFYSIMALGEVIVICSDILFH